MSTEANDNVTITAQCLCKAHTFSTEVARSSLPLEGNFCHCHSCRHLTGAMYSSCTLWPGPGDEIQQSSLKAYVFSNRLHALFCGTCSSKMFWQVQPDKPDDPFEYEVFTGTLSNLDIPTLVQFSHQIFVGDTLDGGASPWLRTPNQNGAVARRWLAHSEKSQEIDGDWPSIDSLPEATVKAELEDIPIRCCCKGVDLVLRRSNVEFAETPRSELPWFVDPVTRKGMASFDVCNSCRRQCGSDIFHWTFSLLRQVGFPQKAAPGTQQGGSSFPVTSSELRDAVTTSAQSRDPRFGTLTLYASSPDVQRYFCSRCSASVFYCVDDRPDTTDIALGLLEAPSGARAEEVVSWSLGSNAAHRGDMAGGWRDGHMNAVESAAEAWRVARKYPKHWRTVEKEEAMRG